LLIHQSIYASPQINQLDTISVLGTSESKAEAGKDKMFSENQVTEYKSKKEIETYKGHSVADLLTGTTGVYSGDARNSGALDPNIRGVQGQGRIPVLVDGTEQAITVWRGFAGVSNRNYLDPFLISSVSVEKGPNLNRTLDSGAAGTIRLSTLEPDDIIKKGEKAAREKYRTELQDSIRYYTVTQYFFFKQWLALKEYANGKGVKIIGDMPIYVSADSVEMWTMPELFKVDENNEPLYVAGCPADDFSPTGQLWGNPIYDWAKHKEQGFSWWIYRVQESFKIYDVLRIDHFKGFSDFWQIDKDAENAVNGTWEAGPGIELFQKIKEQLGDLPIIAENLGFIDAKAEKLLDDSGYPGMKILQFAFPGDDNLDRPHHYTQNSVAYTGTHDNDVVNGWYEKLSESEQELVSEYLNRRDDETITEAMIRGIYSSVSDYAIVTMQDLLDKDATSRMNVPSTVGGNWEWRMLAEDLTEERKEFLKNITVRYSRERA